MLRAPDKLIEIEVRYLGDTPYFTFAADGSMNDDIPSVGVSVLYSLSVRKVTLSEVATYISIKFLPPALACIFSLSVIQLTRLSASLQ